MEISEILEKINQTQVQKGQKVVVAFPGGLDSSLAIPLLRHIYQAKEIIPITIDVGQGKGELSEVHEKAISLGIEPLIIDAKEEFSNGWLSKAIQANSDYNGYPVSTSMTRQLVASFSPEIRSIKSVLFDQRWCAHAAKIRGLPFKILAKCQHNLLKGGV